MKIKNLHWRPWLSILVVVLSIGFYINYLVVNFANIPSFQWGASALAVGFFSVTLVVFYIFVSGFAWLFLLRDHGFQPSLQQVQIIFSITQFGKYLPGNVGHYLGRVFMAREIEIPAAVTVNTMLVEALWSSGLGVGLTLLALVFFIDGQIIGFQFGSTQLWLSFLLLMFLPWLGVNFVNGFMPRLAKGLSCGDKIVAPQLKTSLIVALLYLLIFLIMGFILKLQALWFFDVNAGSVIELSCLLAIALLAGQLVPGAPGGLGVREAMMVMVLSPVLGAGEAVGLSFTLRLTTTLGDAVAFALGILGRKYLA